MSPPVVVVCDSNREAYALRSLAAAEEHLEMIAEPAFVAEYR